MLAQETVERKMNDDSLNDVSIVNILNDTLMYRVKVFKPQNVTFSPHNYSYLTFRP